MLGSFLYLQCFTLAEYLVIIAVRDHLSAAIMYFQLDFQCFCSCLYSLGIQTEVGEKSLTLGWTDWFCISTA